ncbi:hypothetical protein XELAEV_18000227mg [Xenopus laevis]|uniref:Uncharacterized protein n=1 Tax=Xenopus laevis TaxID=8355 RepID=A0A974GZA1_XENLA|nr:hypothetical protein XELAEV_18000227mg [Xenopus laevis]
MLQKDVEVVQDVQRLHEQTKKGMLEGSKEVLFRTKMVLQVLQEDSIQADRKGMPKVLLINVKSSRIKQHIQLCKKQTPLYKRPQDIDTKWMYYLLAMGIREEEVGPGPDISPSCFRKVIWTLKKQIQLTLTWWTLEDIQKSEKPHD